MALAFEPAMSRSSMEFYENLDGSFDGSSSGDFMGLLSCHGNKHVQRDIGHMEEISR